MLLDARKIYTDFREDRLDSNVLDFFNGIIFFLCYFEDLKKIFYRFVALGSSLTFFLLVKVKKMWVSVM